MHTLVADLSAIPLSDRQEMLSSYALRFDEAQLDKTKLTIKSENLMLMLDAARSVQSQGFLVTIDGVEYHGLPLPKRLEHILRQPITSMFVAHALATYAQHVLNSPAEVHKNFANHMISPEAWLHAASSTLNAVQDTPTFNATVR